MKRSRPPTRRKFLASVAGILAGSGGLCARAISRPSPAVPDATRSLAASIRGVVLLPGDPSFERVRRVVSHNPDTDMSPGVIVRCADAADVARAVRFAREQNLEIAVRGGGHDVLGRSTTAGGIVIDLSLMQRIDVGEASVKVDAGVRAGRLNDALQQHRLAVPLGCHPNVGVAGLTLGGGLGWLVGKHGATCDSATAFEVVTADGQRLRAAADADSDLFWALRGGGGNFGVVTSIEFSAYAQGEVLRGFVIYSAAHLRRFMDFYRDFMRTAPDDLTVEVVIGTAREPLVTATFCHAGDARVAARAIEPLLGAVPVLAHDVATVPYARLTDPPESLVRAFYDPPDPRMEGDAGTGPHFNHWRGASIDEWQADAIDALVQCFRDAPAGYSIGIGHYVHGAISRVDDAATPLLRRRGSSSYFFNVDWRDPERTADAMGWVNQSIGRMAPHAAPAYVNYLSSEATRDVAQSYGTNFPRLRALKARYDPDNVFRLNRNIPPSHVAAMPAPASPLPASPLLRWPSPRLRT